MKKAKFSSRQNSGKNLKCKNCSNVVENVDANATAVTCWRCVCKMLNPRSIILSDLNREEIKKLLDKHHGRSKNPTT
jgi:hypothetical protein